jgi:hypothetical protein
VLFLSGALQVPFVFYLLVCFLCQDRDIKNREVLFVETISTP